MQSWHLWKEVLGQLIKWTLCLITIECSCLSTPHQGDMEIVTLCSTQQMVKQGIQSEQVTN